MPGEVMTCSEAHRQIAAYLRGEACLELEAHLATCDACLEACMEAGLRAPARVSVPENFGQRLGARLPETTPEPSRYPWAIAAALICCAVLTLVLASTGAFTRIAHEFEGAVPLASALFIAGAIETLFVLAWCWRVCSEP